MLVITANVLYTFILAFCNLAGGASTESIALSLGPTSPALPYSTSCNEPMEILEALARVARVRHVSDNPDGRPPLQQTSPEQHRSELAEPPKQVCPTDPPILCYMHNCVGSPDPPDPYRCRSRSTTNVDSIETTLFACRCCPDFSHIYCDAEICDGEEEKKCKTELLKGCHCSTRNPAKPPLEFFASVSVCPLPPGSHSTQEQSMTPTEPLPASSEFWNLSSGSCKDAARYNVPWKHAKSEMLLQQTSRI